MLQTKAAQAESCGVGLAWDLARLAAAAPEMATGAVPLSAYFIIKFFGVLK
jgi:hypothetical protein